MTEVLFYHLQRMPLEQVLPILLERCVQRGWRSIVLTGSPERTDALNGHLWTYRDDSFLAHGTAADGHSGLQPIYITDEFANPNKATVLFLVDGSMHDGAGEFDRCVDLFDGNDETATEAARGRYRAALDAGFEVTYWQQNSDGNWVNPA